MNNVQLCELTALPQPSISNETVITIQAENASTTFNNNGKFKSYFISGFNDQSKFSWKFQAQVKTINKIPKFPSGVKFLYSFCTLLPSCFAYCCPLFFGFWFSQSLLSTFSRNSAFFKLGQPWSLMHVCQNIFIIKTIFKELK